MPDVPVAPAAPAAVPTNGAVKPAAPAAPEEFFDIVVDGKTEKIAKSKALERLRKDSFAEKRAQQAAEEIKKAKADRAAWEAEKAEDARLKKEDRRAWLKKHEIDEDAHAREVLERKLAEQGMTAEQKRIAELEASDKQHRAEAEKRAKADAEATVHQTAKKIEELMIRDLGGAAQKAGWEVTDATRPWVLDRLREAVGEAREIGLPVTSDWPDRVVEIAMAREEAAFGHLQKTVLRGLKGEALAKRLGPEVVKEVLAHSVAQLRGKRGFGPPPGAPAIAPPKQQANPYMSVRDFDAKMRAEREKIK